ncbi:Heat shock protein beta-1 [Caligus rogercresseyi]|uniref:Heat shock protein beta-1 n=1 Tax=Caligus rogercresseyi TaxID=217165 RepID=A0A7T8KL26_CALRO|nr:Heat shock protein beta-1 [Caligus rogercresseyi]
MSVEIQRGDRVPVTLRDMFWNDPFFSSTWDDFGRIREQMMKRSSEMMMSFQEEMKKMESSMSSQSISKSIQQSSNSSSDTRNTNSTALDILPSSPMGGPLSPLFFSRGNLFSEDFNKSLNIFQDKDEQVIRIKDDEDKFEYRPDEVKVNIKDGVVSIEGKHEEKSSDGCKFVSRQFLRSYPLPKNSKAERVSSNLSSDGILVITAPKIKQTPIDGQDLFPSP